MFSAQNEVCCGGLSLLYPLSESRGAELSFSPRGEGGGGAGEGGRFVPGGPQVALLYLLQRFANCPSLSSPLLLCYRIKELDFEKLDLYEFLRHVKTCESDGLPEFQEFVFFA